MSNVAKLLRIHGRVQGVGYRQSLRYQAARLGVAGWVRNRRDGTVEALVSGQAEAVQAILRWAEQGPPLAGVEQVAVTEPEPAPACYGEFSILPTE